MPLELVRADREPPAIGGKPVERRDGSGIGPARFGDAAGVDVQEHGDEVVQALRVGGHAGGEERV